MGSKTPPPGKPPHRDSREGDAARHPNPKHLVTKTASLQRIAGALQMSPAVLYQLPNAIRAVGSAEATTDNGGLDRECRALVHAFLRISDAEERRRLLALVQASVVRA